MKTHKNRRRTKIGHEFVRRVNDLFNVSDLDVMKLFDVEQ